METLVGSFGSAARSIDSSGGHTSQWAGAWFNLVARLLAATGQACTAPDPTSGPGAEPVAERRCPTFVEASSGLPEIGEWKTYPSLADINGDGLDDIAVLARQQKGPRVFLSDGVGNWREASEGLRYDGSISCGIGTQLLDINGDGNLDLLVGDHCAGVRLFLGDGGEGWSERTAGIPRNMGGFNDAEAGDLDGDGLYDIVAISQDKRGFLVLMGRPDGRFEPRWENGLPPVGAGNSIDLVDMDGNGTLDVLSTYRPTRTDKRYPKQPPAKVWLQGEDGWFSAAEGFPREGRDTTLTIVPRAEGAPDLIVARYGAFGGLWRFQSDDGRNWRDEGRIDEGFFPERPGFVGVTTADVDADGCFDLLATERLSRKVWLALGDCAGGYAFCPEETFPIETTVGGWGVRTGDLNGDGRLDVVAAFGSNQVGSIRAWFQDQGQGPPVLSASLGSGTSPDEP